MKFLNGTDRISRPSTATNKRRRDYQTEREHSDNTNRQQKTRPSDRKPRTQEAPHNTTQLEKRENPRIPNCFPRHFKMAKHCQSLQNTQHQIPERQNCWRFNQNQPPRNRRLPSFDQIPWCSKIPLSHLSTPGLICTCNIYVTVLQ